MTATGSVLSVTVLRRNHPAIFGQVPVLEDVNLAGEKMTALKVCFALR